MGPVYYYMQVRHRTQMRRIVGPPVVVVVVGKGFRSAHDVQANKPRRLFPMGRAVR